jgi:UTP--glucose-1-phosphate uridylyltransferase
MVANFNASGAAQVMVEKVPAELVNQYGVADIDGVKLAPGDQASIKRLVEKPPIAEAPSDLAVVGRYVFPAALWALLEKTPPGAGNEIQLTDAMAMLLEQQPVNAYYMKGKSHDCGNKLGYAQAFVEHAARHPAFGADFKDWLRQLS